MALSDQVIIAVHLQVCVPGDMLRHCHVPYLHVRAAQCKTVRSGDHCCSLTMCRPRATTTPGNAARNPDRLSGATVRGPLSVVIGASMHCCDAHAYPSRGLCGYWCASPVTMVALASALGSRGGHRGEYERARIATCSRTYLHELFVFGRGDVARIAPST